MAGGKLSKILYTDCVTNTQDPRRYFQMQLLGPKNTITTCQYCNTTVMTSVKYTPTIRTHLIAAIYGVMCCCCFLPYCSTSTMNTDHYCPNCEHYLGTYEK